MRDRRLFHLLLARLPGRDVYSVLPDLDEEGLRGWARRRVQLQLAALRRTGAEDGFGVLALAERRL